MCTNHVKTSYCVSVTEHTTAKCYAFVLYNKKPELNSLPKRLEIEKVSIQML